jgi:hypothetical protein
VHLASGHKAFAEHRPEPNVTEQHAALAIELRRIRTARLSDVVSKRNDGPQKADSLSTSPHTEKERTKGKQALCQMELEDKFPVSNEIQYGGPTGRGLSSKWLLMIFTPGENVQTENRRGQGQ